MKTVTYVGEHKEVEVPDARASVKRNETLEVSDDLAARLLEQPDNWSTGHNKKKELK